MATVAEMLPSKGKAAAQVKEESQFTIIAKRFLRHRMAVISLIMLLLIFAASLLAPVVLAVRTVRGPSVLLGPVRPDRADLAGEAVDGGRLHGTDRLGKIELVERNLG